MVALYLAIAMLCEYFLGNVSFARIFSWAFAKKDITEVGSKNPGTMNMLRTRGLGEALLTLFFDAIKVGLPALAMYFTFEHFFVGYGNLAYFLVGFSGIIGHCFPVIYKFKGGKGVASTFGMFLFHPIFWWVSLVMFGVCFLLFMFIEYGFIISNIFILTMTIYSTCMFAIYQPILFVPLIVVVWINFFLVIVMHRGNIKRLLAGTENKVNFREKVFTHRAKKKVANVEQAQVNVESASERVETGNENVEKGN